MKNQLNKVIFFGTEDFSANSLTELINSDYDVVAVVTKPDSARGRGKNITEPIVKTIAKQNNIEVWQPENINEIADQISRIENRIGILVSYGKIISKEILNLFEPIGIINLHPSLLPKYRGPSPIESTILNGDQQTGISFIKLIEEMDAGPLYYQKTVKLTGQETSVELYSELSKIGAIELKGALPRIISGELKPLPQDDSKTSYTKLIKKSDGEINWNEPAETIIRKIRAYQGWPKARTTLGEINVSIIGAYSAPSSIGKPGDIGIIKEAGLVSVEATDGCIYIQKLQPDGKNIMTASDFIRGYGSKIEKSS